MLCRKILCNTLISTTPHGNKNQRCGSTSPLDIRVGQIRYTGELVPADDSLLFIDANKYLDLYRINPGKKLLAPLGEQVDYIFVTQQVFREVQRNKILVAADFLKQKSKEIKLQTFNLPDHLSSSSIDHRKDILQQMEEIHKKIKNVNAEVDALMFSIMEQISCSDDEVSKALSPIFANAIPHSPEELQRARDRRELGNPPGKSNSPIGDQLTWEQILTHFKGKKRLWIISRDGDYGTVYGGRGFLNRFLYNELCGVASEPEVYLFKDMVEGIRHFVDTTGVKAEQHLTPEEVEEIEKEEKSLPHLTQPSEYARRLLGNMTQLTQPSEYASRLLGDITQFPEPSEYARRLLGEITQLTQTSENLRKVLGDMTQFTQLSENARKVLGDTTQFTQLSENARKVLGDMTQFTQPNEHFRKVLSDMTQFTQPNEHFRKVLDGLDKSSTPMHESLKGDQEDKKEDPPNSLFLSQEDDNGEKKDNEGKTE
jgi:PIN domain